MPRGEHITTCVECGGTILSGDCIEMVCKTCEGKHSLLREHGYNELPGLLCPKWVIEWYDGENYQYQVLRTSLAYEDLRYFHPELPDRPDTLWLFKRWQERKYGKAL